MKKMFVLALAVSFSTSAFAAGPEKDKKATDAAQREKMMETMKAFKAGAKVDPKILSSAKEVKSSGLVDHLNPEQSHTLSMAFAKDPSIRSKVQNIEALVKSKKLSEDGAKVLLSGLANVSKLDAKFRDPKAVHALPEDKAKQAYASLILGAGEMAKNAPEATAKNFIEVAKLANEGAAKGKFDEGMQDALKKLREITKNDKLTMEDLNRLCPPVA